jgi:hypothetical protein
MINFPADIFMSGLDKYAFLPTTACEVVPYVTTVNVTYNGAIVSVDQVGTSSDFTSSSNMPLSQYIASVMDYQAGSNQAPTKNTIGDFLTAYGTSNTTQIYSELVTVSASSDINMADCFAGRLLAWYRGVLRYCE